MKLFYATLALGLLLPIVGQTRDKAGNGGDAVVCRDAGHHIISAELLDFYEARTLRDMKLDLGAPSLSYSDKLELAMKRLDRISPVRAGLLRAAIKDFAANARFLSGAQLTQIPDAEPVSFPEGCAVEQLAVQKPPEFPGEKYYTIDQDIWDKLSEEGRAGLILHELLYREGISYGHENSLRVRYLNSVIACPDALAPIQTPKQIYDLMILVHFSVTDFRGVRISLSGGYCKQPCIFDENYLDGAGFTPTGELKWGIVAYPSLDTITIQSQALKATGTVSFYDSGALHFLGFDGKFKDHSTGVVYSSPVTFFPEGKVQEGVREPFRHPVSHLLLSGITAYNHDGGIIRADLEAQTIHGKNYQIKGEFSQSDFFLNGLPASVKSYFDSDFKDNWYISDGRKILMSDTCRQEVTGEECVLKFSSTGYLISFEDHPVGH